MIDDIFYFDRMLVHRLAECVNIGGGKRSGWDKRHYSGIRVGQKYFCGSRIGQEQKIYSRVTLKLRPDSNTIIRPCTKPLSLLRHACGPRMEVH